MSGTRYGNPDPGARRDPSRRLSGETRYVDGDVNVVT
jgi:hypothetical protein